MKPPHLSPAEADGFPVKLIYKKLKCELHGDNNCHKSWFLPVTVRFEAGSCCCYCLRKQSRRHNNVWIQLTSNLSNSDLDVFIWRYTKTFHLYKKTTDLITTVLCDQNCQDSCVFIFLVLSWSLVFNFSSTLNWIIVFSCAVVFHSYEGLLILTWPVVPVGFLFWKKLS